MANKITYNIGYQVDKASLDEIKRSLESLSNFKATDAMNLNKQLGFENAEQGIKIFKSALSALDNSLSKAFNKDLGTVNITKFRQELESTRIQVKKLGLDFNLTLNNVERILSLAGAEGNTAFRKMASSILTTNIQLKETHSLLDSMATTMKNTIKWSISSSIMNSFTGSVQQAYGYVKNLDRSLNDIRIVTQKSADDMADFAVQANKAAQSLAASTTDYTNASLIYYQQGKLNPLY